MRGFPRGLPILIGVGLVILNFILMCIPVISDSFLGDTNLFLHLGIVIAIMGLLIGEVI